MAALGAASPSWASHSPDESRGWKTSENEPEGHVVYQSSVISRCSSFGLRGGAWTEFDQGYFNLRHVCGADLLIITNLG